MVISLIHVSILSVKTWNLITNFDYNYVLVTKLFTYLRGIFMCLYLKIVYLDKAKDNTLSQNFSHPLSTQTPP